MDDSIIIYKYLTREFLDNHQAIYLYVSGGDRSKTISIQQIIKHTEKIFCPPLEPLLLKTVIKDFLDYKNKQYFKGEIKVKGIYT